MKRKRVPLTQEEKEALLNSGKLLFSQKVTALIMDVGVRYLRDEGDIRPRELPGHGPKKKPLLKYHRDDIVATIAKWHEEQRGRRRAKRA